MTALLTFFSRQNSPSVQASIAARNSLPPWYRGTVGRVGRPRRYRYSCRRTAVVHHADTTRRRIAVVLLLNINDARDYVAPPVARERARRFAHTGSLILALPRYTNTDPCVSAFYPFLIKTMVWGGRGRWYSQH